MTIDKGQLNWRSFLGTGIAYRRRITRRIIILPMCHGTTAHSV